MSTSITDPNVDRLLEFWFDPQYPMTRWFVKDDTLDHRIKTNFGNLVAKARTTELDTWCKDPKGTLALIVLLDQFSRNIYRGTSDSFAADEKAREVAITGIAKGFDRRVSLIQQMFLYLPLMHHESILGQIASKALFEGLVNRCDLGTQEHEQAKVASASAQAHVDVILKFGRFPARNKAIGRTSTAEEVAFLDEYPAGLKPI
ncbi:uncharacterized protein KY384_001713 [Bacidia gigantensis]|uniref:uncharacterized protein n=1 Tax=Bacidia gigantensis TaxID=2732470 RepID=UPI001D058DE8|nr:uncharacterized protein KY384_001713 [Bacidia gigantensis]KAG8533970.1 hypothetical protein KY384_001713 [Bacidia gigantensis]